jgi:hypothetical protein
MKKIVFLKEKRLSLKIFAHKLKNLSPQAYYIYIYIHFLFFKNKCRDLKSQTFYSDGSWLRREVTCDTKNIVSYLKKGKDLKILEIGIGNSYLYSKLKNNISLYNGITIMQNEYDYAAKHLNISNKCRVFLMNKNSLDLNKLGGKGKFNLIIDTDLGSYSCCKFHFNLMILNYKKLLLPSGKILIGLRGLNYFDTGFPLTPYLLERCIKSSFTLKKLTYFYILTFDRN